MGTEQSLLDNAEDFTMAGWVMARNPAGSRIGLFGQNDLVEMGFNGGSASIWTAASGTTNAAWAFADTTWHHIAIVDEGTEMRIYIDGELASTGSGGSHGTSGFNFNIGGGGVWDGTGNWFDGQIDDVVLFTRALTEEEILQVMEGASNPALAGNPKPAEDAIDVPRDVVLNWTAGEFAVKHDAYFGTSFNDANDATVANPGGVLVGPGLADTTFDPGRLEFDQTYYWRVDEANGAPDFTVFKGDVWNFTVEPFSIPIGNITATASSSFGASGPEKTVDGSGLTGDLHGTNAADMWISGGIPATIDYAFDRAYKLHELWIWNSNQLIEAFVGFGAKDV
ncbi:MAG: LamG domain-containing protein, partial [Planctomycetes bacterium]|nr:LamG domain-containing protein [Planctomycetota bacterium]